MLALMTRKQEEPTQRSRVQSRDMIRDKKGVTYPQRGQYLKKTVPIGKDNVLRLIVEASVLL